MSAAYALLWHVCDGPNVRFLRSEERIRFSQNSELTLELPEGRKHLGDSSAVELCAAYSMRIMIASQETSPHQDQQRMRKAHHTIH